MLPLYQNKIILGEANSHTFWEYLDTTVSFSEHLFLQNSSIFSFFRIAFFRSETSTEQPLLENTKFFTAVTFRNSYIFQRNSLGQRYLKNSHFFKASTSAQHQSFKKSYILEKVNFSEKEYSALPTFFPELSFSSGYFFKRLYLLQKLPFQKSCFFATYFFRRFTISQLLCLFTGTILIYLLVIKWSQ